MAENTFTDDMTQATNHLKTAEYQLVLAETSDPLSRDEAQWHLVRAKAHNELAATYLSRVSTAIIVATAMARGDV